MKIHGNIVDIRNKSIFPGCIEIENGFINNIEPDSNNYENYIMPGFIDAHIHIESSMLIPSEFARIAVTHGTVATVSDPHEIANVCGIDGVKYMIENGNKTPFKFYFGAPSCVPATDFETSGAKLDASDINYLFKKYNLKYLSEMMNYPGVIYDTPEVMAKIEVAKNFSKPIDGHAPGLKGDDLKKYIDAGISTDHECYTLQEAKEKLSLGMKILIREGSAAKNFDALHPIIKDNKDMVMFCSDDKHPDDLLIGHINLIVKKAISLGYDLFDVLQIACINPIKHYSLDVGTLQKNESADFIIVDNLKDFNVIDTYINGRQTSHQYTTFIPSIKTEPINNFNLKEKTTDEFEVKYTGGKMRVIEAMEGQLITNEITVIPKVFEDKVISDIENDILKITVIDRYKDVKPSIAFIKNFGLKKGALASCVGHDSHNIIAVGVDDSSLATAVNEIIKNKGGISIVFDDKAYILPLPVGGIMSKDDAYTVAEKYSEINKLPLQAGCTLHSPFMTLSFMALLVIPVLKLGDKGLFDGEKFKFVDLFVN